MQSTLSKLFGNYETPLGSKPCISLFIPLPQNTITIHISLLLGDHSVKRGRSGEVRKPID